MMYRSCPVLTETEPVPHLLSITEAFDSQKAKMHNWNVLGRVLRRSICPSVDKHAEQITQWTKFPKNLNLSLLCCAKRPSATGSDMWEQMLISSSVSCGCFCFFCRVIQSNNPAFPVGSCVVGRCGWRTHTVSDGTDLTAIMPDWPKDVSLSLALGTIGMPGWDRC